MKSTTLRDNEFSTDRLGVCAQGLEDAMRYVVATIAVLIVVCSGVAMAQETTGDIIGTITSQDGMVLPGVSVQVEDADRGVTRTAISASDGRYKLAVLPPGQYVLIASMDGFQTMNRTVTAALGRTTTSNLQMRLGAVTEIIEVTGVPPQVDVVSNVSGMTVNTDQLNSSVPLGRELSQVVLLAPGTMQGDRAFDGNTPGQNLASMGGASVAENTYQLNGLNITNFFNGLGSTFVPMEFVQELQVKTGGYEAEYGRSTGGVVNMVTKSGTNSFRGQASVYFLPESLQEQEPDTYRAYNQDELTEEVEYNASIGGPVVKDHLFFFAFVRYWDRNRLGLLTTTGKTFELAQPYYGGKVDWNITSNHRLEATYISDDVDTDVAGL